MNKVERIAGEWLGDWDLSCRSLVTSAPTILGGTAAPQGRKFTVLFQGEDFAGESGEDIKEPGVAERVLADLLRQGPGRKPDEEIAILAGDDLERGFGQRDGVVGGDEVESGLAAVAEEVEVFLASEVTLVTFGMPAGDVHGGDGIGQGRVGGGLELFDDEPVRRALIEQMVDEIALGFREASDLAVATVLAGGGLVGLHKNKKVLETDINR